MNDDELDAAIDSAIDAELDNQLNERDAKVNKQKTARFQQKTRESPEFQEAQKLNESGPLDSAFSGVKSGIGGLVGGRDSVAGLAGTLGDVAGGGSPKQLIREYASRVIPNLLMPFPDSLPGMNGPKEELAKLIAPDVDNQAGNEEMHNAELEQANSPGIGLGAELVSPLIAGKLGAKGPVKAPAALSAGERVRGALGSGKPGKLLQAFDSLRGIIDPGEGKGNSYGRFGIQVDSGKPPPLPIDSGEPAINKVMPEDILSSRQDPLAGQDPSTVFASKAEDQIRQLQDELSNRPKPPDYPPDPDNVFQFSPRQEIPMGPEANQGSVFEPYNDPQSPFLENKEDKVNLMADMLERELLARQKTKIAPGMMSPKAKMARQGAIDLNFPRDTVFSENMPRSDLAAEKIGTQDDRPRRSMQPKQSISPFNEPEEPDVPQWVRDEQHDDQKPTFGDKGRPDDEQNLKFLEQMNNAHQMDKAESMMRQYFGDEYVDYLIKNMDFE